MTIKEDLERALAYGTEAYYAAIRQTQGYQTELAKVQTDFKGRSWIESPFKLPRFTDDQFEARRLAYQAKYGSTVIIPNLDDIFHLKLPIKISAEEMAAHNYAKRKKLPSPLGPDQLRAIAGRRARYIRALQSPTPTWLKNVGSVMTMLDNAEDALVTAAVLGRLAVKAAPRLLGKLIPGLGWVLLGSDILNLANITAQLTWAVNGRKRLIEDLTEKNPFHRKAWANRAAKLKRTWPTFGEILEVAQTTDQMFGIGICLGGIFGLVQDVMDAGVETIGNYLGMTAATVAYPTKWEVIWGDQLKGAGALLAGFGDILKADYELTLMTAESALAALLPWWFKNDPLKNAKYLGMYPIRPPKITNLATYNTLWDVGIDPNRANKWPILDLELASIQELTMTYAPGIKDGFQAYALENSHDYTAMMASHQVVKYHETIVSALSDDWATRVGQTAYSQVAKEMSRDVLQIPPDTPKEKVDILSDWIRDYERQTGQAPGPREVEHAGKLLGIQWDRKFPRITFGKAAELFPEWKNLQEQLQELFIAD